MHPREASTKTFTIHNHSFFKKTVLPETRRAVFYESPSESYMCMALNDSKYKKYTYYTLKL